MDGQSIDRKYTSYLDDAATGNLKIAYNMLFDSLGFCIYNWLRLLLTTQHNV